MRGMGRIFKRGEVWWISYYVNGKERRESARSSRDTDARRLLRNRLKQIHGGTYVGPKEERITVDQLLDDLLVHLDNKGAKTVARLKSHLKPLRQFFALDRASTLQPQTLNGTSLSVSQHRKPEQQLI
jgi:hypothetical protein